MGNERGRGGGGSRGGSGSRGGGGRGRGASRGRGRGRGKDQHRQNDSTVKGGGKQKGKSDQSLPQNFPPGLAPNTQNGSSNSKQNKAKIGKSKSNNPDQSRKQQNQPTPKINDKLKDLEIKDKNIVADVETKTNATRQDYAPKYFPFQQQLNRFSLKEVAREVPPNSTILCVAEKPSLAQSIAYFLAGGKSKVKSRKSFQEVHEFSAMFFGKQAKFKVTSVIGHVYSLDFKLPKHKSWDIDPIELFDAPTERVEANPKAHICKHLHQEAKNCDYLLLWLDCDREGENICFEVIENAKPNMKRSGLKFNILRAKFSAITEGAIRTAMQNLTLPNENEAMAVDSRQELDLKVGVSFTRFQTRFFQGKYSNLDASVVSYGPCQTPTLGFCVERHILQVQHVPKPYWTLAVEGKKSGETFPLSTNDGRMFDQKKAQKAKALLAESGPATVLNVDEKKGSLQRPTGLNTVDMLKMASTSLGMSPHHAMMIAERLYMQGYLSYPRTESTGYPQGFDMKGLLYAQVNNRYWGNYVRSLLEIGFTKPRPGKDVGDHPPITPMCNASENDLGGGDSWRLYDLVTRHFIASVSPDATFLTTKVELQSGNVKLSCSGKRPLSPGFTSVQHHSAIQSSILPAFKIGDIVEIVDISIKQGETTPPPHLSESELIGMMEKHGIGTDASIPTHIKNVCERRYCYTDSGRHMVPTSLGLLLVQGYRLIDKDLVLPTVRSYIEKQIDQVALGKISKEAVMRKSLSEFTSKFKHFVEDIEKMDNLFEASFTNAVGAQKPFTRCGKTNRYLKIINSRPPKLYNPLTEEIYLMPLGGAVKQYKSLACPICNFELLLYHLGQKSYPLCPNCYCNPPEGMSEPEKGLITTCPMDDKHPIVSKLAVCDCPESDGLLIVDPVGGPNWKLVSTRSPLIAHFPAGINKVSVLPELDENGSHLIEIDFNKNSTTLKDGSTKYKGGLSDPFLEGLLQYKHGNERGIMGRGRRGRGRGKGRGRGRGRGRGKDFDPKMSFWAF